MVKNHTARTILFLILLALVFYAIFMIAVYVAYRSAHG
jgi:hypothetical protein